MLCGQLPFDEESMPNLFNRIKKSRFYMPNYISDEAKDLINRLLQPLPMKRIKLSEIKEHPWFKRELPCYLNNLLNKKSTLSHNSLKGKKTDSKKHSSFGIDEVDLEIVEQLFDVTLNFIY